jgi:hypothetical protein
MAVISKIVLLDGGTGYTSSPTITLVGGVGTNLDNSAKAVEMQYKNILTEKIVFTYNNFFGDEQVVSNRPRFRGYHNLILENKFNDVWQFLFAVDFGHQSQQTEQGVDTWSTSTITTRRIIDFNRSLALRLEHYNDAQEANVKTPLKKGFIVQGGSINYDQILLGQILWRTEYRYFQSKQKISLKNVFFLIFYV